MSEAVVRASREWIRENGKWRMSGGCPSRFFHFPLSMLHFQFPEGAWIASPALWAAARNDDPLLVVISGSTR
ncbi:MAG: hypothetical protein LBT00_09265 [Spirochaetaceae bacterium]|nr:hypothetical protein [Spirochaetaceae bacterium]